MAVTRHKEVKTPVRTSGGFSVWLGRHFNMAGQSLLRLLRQPFASLMTILVIAVTLAFGAGFVAVGLAWAAVESGLRQRDVAELVEDDDVPPEMLTWEIRPTLAHALHARLATALEELEGLLEILTDAANLSLEDVEQRWRALQRRMGP